MDQSRSGCPPCSSVLLLQLVLCCGNFSMQKSVLKFLLAHLPLLLTFLIGMLIENRISGFRFENQNPVFDFENRFSNLFFKIIFPIQNYIMLKINSGKDKFMHLLCVYCNYWKSK